MPIFAHASKLGISFYFPDISTKSNKTKIISLAKSLYFFVVNTVLDSLNKFSRFNTKPEKRPHQSAPLTHLKGNPALKSVPI